MKKSSKSSNRGFTLIELLVVVAIIGLLSSVVLASLNTARSKSRDAKRVTDLKQIQLALELYADQNSGQYPPVLSGFVNPNYISNLPADPNGSAYLYSALGTGSSCTGYHLGAVMETNNPVILGSDRDYVGGGVACSGTGAVFDGNATACSGTAAAITDTCFDVVNQ